MTSMVLEGMKGLFLEPAYMILRRGKKCEDCKARWFGYYAFRHMHYCHHCSKELDTVKKR